MENKLSGERLETFCQVYLQTLDPQRAAQAAGGGDGFSLLGTRAVCRRLERLRAGAGAQILREDAVRRLAELAFGRANDAAALALDPAGQQGHLAELDLRAVSELKVTDKGVEIKFLDRVRALEALGAMLGEGGGGAEEFFRALAEESEAAQP